MPDWPHSPPHRFFEPGTYMITAGTYKKAHIFNAPEKLSFLTDKIFALSSEFEISLQAWAIMSNHYHFICSLGESPEKLKSLLYRLHKETALKINEIENTPGRKVWFQYWDRQIRDQKSYFARLKYVHENPVHHGIVPVAENYEWCSASWFKFNAPSGFRRMIGTFKTDKLSVFDEF
ncbi:MAG: hypothetical protein NT118_10465 [Lentisphaerae bacterium]|nr:hypothetical protein [Lentisphaerota bacterium]